MEPSSEAELRLAEMRSLGEAELGPSSETELESDSKAESEEYSEVEVRPGCGAKLGPDSKDQGGAR